MSFFERMGRLFGGAPAVAPEPGCEEPVPVETPRVNIAGPQALPVQLTPSGWPYWRCRLTGALTRAREMPGGGALEWVDAAGAKQRQVIKPGDFLVKPFGRGEGRRVVDGALFRSQFELYQEGRVKPAEEH
jgi:hypothetical protein